MRQFLEQQLHTGLLIQRRIVGDDARLAEKLGYDPFMHIAVLTQVECGQMEPENLDRTDQTPQRPTAGKGSVPVLCQSCSDGNQVGAQFVRPGIRFTL